MRRVNGGGWRADDVDNERAERGGERGSANKKTKEKGERGQTECSSDGDDDWQKEKKDVKIVSSKHSPQKNIYI